MLDSFAVGNLIGENLSLKGRILIDEIPSGRDHLTTLLEAMKENHAFPNNKLKYVLLAQFANALRDSKSQKSKKMLN